MTWLLVVFMPAHTRGRITLPGADLGATAQASDDCCAPKHKSTESKPSDRDRANCAVCFWAAGLLTTPAITFDHVLAERAFEIARQYDAQVRRETARLTHHGRDPPMSLG